MIQLFQVDSSVSMKIDEFENLIDLWWSFSLLNRVNDFRELQERWSTSEINEISFWLTQCSTDWVSWWDINQSAWRCFALKFNRSLCSWLIFSSNSSFFSKATSSYFALFLWSSCTRIQCSLSCKVRSRWLWSLFSISIIWSSWFATHWHNCFLFFMFHDVVASSASTETSMSRSETLLLTVFLNRWAVQDSTDLTLHVMMIVGRSCWDKDRWEIDVLIWCKFKEALVNFLIIADCIYLKNFLRIEWWKWM